VSKGDIAIAVKRYRQIQKQIAERPANVRFAPIADIDQWRLHARFVPKADINGARVEGPLRTCRLFLDFENERAQPSLYGRSKPSYLYYECFCDRCDV
jgi:hypothetical protein